MSVFDWLVAFAIRNDQGFWTGIWNDRALAESVLAKGQASHKELIVELCAISPSILGDALEIADSCARADIECECLGAEIAGGRWWDLASADPEVNLDQVVRYLEARDLIERNPNHPSLVRFKE